MANATGSTWGRGVDPWHYQLRAAKRYKAHVYPWAPDRLAISRDFKAGNVVNQELLALPTARLEQDGDDGVTISFQLSDFDAVARRLGLRQRRKLTEDQRRQMAERAASLFHPGKNADKRPKIASKGVCMTQ